MTPRACSPDSCVALYEHNVGHGAIECEGGEIAVHWAPDLEGLPD